MSSTNNKDPLQPIDVVKPPRKRRRIELTAAREDWHQPQNQPTRGTPQLRTLSTDPRSTDHMLTEVDQKEVKQEIAELIASLSTEPNSQYANKIKGQDTGAGKRQSRIHLKVPNQVAIQTVEDVIRHVNRLYDAATDKITTMAKSIGVNAQIMGQVSADTAVIGKLLVHMMDLQMYQVPAEHSQLLNRVRDLEAQLSQTKQQLARVSDYALELEQTNAQLQKPATLPDFDVEELGQFLEHESDALGTAEQLSPSQPTESSDQ